MNLSELWDSFGDIPINGDDEIEAPFLDFGIGTDRFEIWHWFKETFDISIAKDLMYLEENNNLME